MEIMAELERALAEITGMDAVASWLGLVLDVQVGLGLLGVDELRRQLLALGLELPEAALARRERRVGRGELLLEGLAGELLVGQRLPHRLHQVLVLGDRVGRDLVHRAAGAGARAPPSPTA